MNAPLQVKREKDESQPFICAQVDSRVSPASLTQLQVDMLRNDADPKENTGYQVRKPLLYSLKENLCLNNHDSLKQRYFTTPKND